MEVRVSEPFYIARARISKIEGVHRRALLETGTSVDFGVHGAVKEHYRLTDVRNLPLPVDYIVAAAAG
jgi:hypothetical protein